MSGKSFSGFLLPEGTIYAGTGCAILWSAFYQAENKFWASFLVKSQVIINSGVSFQKHNSLGY